MSETNGNCVDRPYEKGTTAPKTSSLAITQASQWSKKLATIAGYGKRNIIKITTNK
jgi:hypothetical protein